VQKSKDGEVNWIIETKGRVWEGTTAKDEAIRDWCERISEATGASWRFVRVDQKDFDSGKRTALSQLADGAMVRSDPRGVVVRRPRVKVIGDLEGANIDL
jgi:hypothetical protein